MKSAVVIDDSPIVRKIIATCLRRAGCQITSFADPVPALRALLVTKEVSPPDMLIIDIGLPHIDGYDVIRRLRNNQAYKHTPIIAISGRNGVLDQLKARLAGANAYVTKPFRTQELVALVQQLISRQRN
jgi:twitching motility two-component system response regulator PilG